MKLVDKRYNEIVKMLSEKNIEFQEVKLEGLENSRLILINGKGKLNIFNDGNIIAKYVSYKTLNSCMFKNLDVLDIILEEDF